MARMRDGESPLARPHGKRRGPRRPWGFIVSFVLFLALFAAIVAARVSFKLIAPHTVFPSTGTTLSPEKRADLDQELDFNRPFDRDQAIDFALDYTAQSLSLSLGHPTSFDFGAGKRGGNCVEYAALFVAVFEAASKRAGSTARAVRVRSQGRVFNKVVPLKGLADHDWVLVYDPSDGARIYLDPTFYDLWLSSNLTRNVKGGAEIQVPIDPPK
jgi:hypothetical protein